MYFSINELATLRFSLNKCQDVSNEDLQEMWAKILADEITKPGAISLRTLDVLSNLVASECKLFEKFISMSFTNIGIYHPYERIYNKFGLTFSDILNLSAAHLIHETEMSSPLGYRAEIDGGIIIFDDKYYSVKKKDNEGVAFDIIKLTPEGQQLAKISNFKYNHDYLVEFFRTIKERGYSYKEIDAEIISSLS